MKLYRNAIILIVVLGLLVGAYFILNNRKNTTDDNPAEVSSESIKLVSYEYDKINLLEFDNEEGKFALTKKDKAWSIEPSSEFAVDNSVADTAATDVSTIMADKVIEENAADLSKYGLDKPSTVKIGLTDGKAEELEIGSNTPTNEGIYVKKKGEPKVYIIGSYYGNRLRLNRSYFAIKDILPVEGKTLKKFAYEKAGQMQYAVDIISETEMKLVAPIEEQVDNTKILPMMDAVVQLKVKDIVDENPGDLAQYGLDKPAYTLEYGDGKTTKKILFGKEEVKGSTTYAKYPDEKSVFTIDTTPLTFLDVKFSNILSTFVFLPNINDVNKIELTIDGKTIVSDITTNKDNKDEDKFKVDGKDANMENEKGNSLFRAFYTSMIGITMNKYEPGAQPSGKPEVTIKYYMKPDSKPVVIYFISKDSNYYYAMKDGEYTNRVILKSDLDKDDGIRSAYKNLKEAIDKAK